MATKYIIFMTVALSACAHGGILPGAFVAPYASTYNAHYINHAIHTPFLAALQRPFAGPGYFAAPGPFPAPAPVPAVAAAAPFLPPASVPAAAPFVSPAPFAAPAPAIYNPNAATYSTLPVAYKSFPGFL